MRERFWGQRLVGRRKGGRGSEAGTGREEQAIAGVREVGERPMPVMMRPRLAARSAALVSHAWVRSHRVFEQDRVLKLGEGGRVGWWCTVWTAGLWVVRTGENFRFGPWSNWSRSTYCWARELHEQQESPTPDEGFRKDAMRLHIRGVRLLAK